MTHQNTSLSKFMTKILRHKANDYGLNIDNEGFVKINDLIDYINKKKYGIANIDLIKEIVEIDKNESKGRFYIDEKFEKIRANQGHSIQVKNLELKKITLENVQNYGLIVHGSYIKHKNSIEQNGLKKLSRIHIHMTDLMTEKGFSLMRQNINMQVVVNLVECIKDGLEFFESTNNVILSKDDIPAKYLTFNFLEKS